MKTATILHGICDKNEYFEMDFPSPSNAHWLPWLQQKFLRDGVLCQCFEMPIPYAPVYDEWKNVFKSADLNEDSIVVAHSAGCGFILKWLHDHKNTKLSKLVLVAPWLDPLASRGDFLKFELKSEIQERIGEIHVLFSDDEPVKGVLQSKDMIATVYSKVRLHPFADKGHFCLGQMGTPEFPELWDICKSG